MRAIPVTAYKLVNKNHYQYKTYLTIKQACAPIECKGGVGPLAAFSAGFCDNADADEYFPN